MMTTNCHYCGEIITGRSIHSDHFIPKSKGGRYIRRNIVLACNICNSIKGDRTFEQSRFRLVLKMIGWPKFTLEQIAWLRNQGFDLTKYDSAKLWFERAGPE